MPSLANKKLLVYIFVLSLTLLVVAVVQKYALVNDRAMFSPPNLNHWFGTDVIGNDIFFNCLGALFVVLMTIGVVLPVIYVGGMLVGCVLSYFDSLRLREFLLNLVHYWVTLPVLLIAMFLLILVGAGQSNVITVLIFVLLPSQSLYVYNRIEEAKKQAFVTAKRSYGLSKGYVLLHHNLPYIKSSFDSYTLSRLPEILMMDLAFNFLGLGVQPPRSSFGKMLFEGLSFMFSAWWMWLFPLALVIAVFVSFNWAVKLITCKEKEHYGQEETQSVG